MTSKRTNASFFTVVILQRNPVRSACFVVLVQKHCWALISQPPWVVASLKQLLHHVASNAKSCIIFTIMKASGGGFSRFTFVLLLSSVNQKQRCAEKCLTTGPLVVGKWERYYLFPSDSVLKNPSANAGDTRVVGLIPGSGRSLEEEMATHSSILAWRIPWTEEPGGLQSMGLQRVRHDSATEHYHNHTWLTTG